MTDITWGREIPVNGVRPAWLADEMWDKVSALLNDGRVQFPDNHTDPCMVDWQWHVIRTLQLPADHFAYTALDKGFEPWGGGDAAPDDWDGDRDGVLYRDGQTAGRAPYRWAHYGYGSDIIGYRKRAESAVFTADTMPVARMTEAAWRTTLGNEALGYTALGTLQFLGLIREETRAERFNRETGHDLTPAVLAALEYER